MLSFNVEAFCTKLEALKLPFEAVTEFGTGLRIILDSGLDFGTGIELPLVFAEERRRFIAAWLIRVPTIETELPWFEDLYRCMSREDRRAAKAELAKFSAARPLATTRPAVA